MFRNLSSNGNIIICYQNWLNLRIKIRSKKGQGPSVDQKWIRDLAACTGHEVEGRGKVYIGQSVSDQSVPISLLPTHDIHFKMADTLLNPSYTNSHQLHHRDQGVRNNLPHFKGSGINTALSMY